MSGLRDLGFYVWLALMALLAPPDAMPVAVGWRGWEPLSPIFSTMWWELFSIEEFIGFILHLLLTLSPLLAALLAAWGLTRLSTTAGGRPLTCAWLALIALLAVSEAMDWDLPVFTLTILSLPATVWGCLSRPVRGRPVLGFALGLLNFLFFPAFFGLTADLIGGLLRGRLPHGWALPDLAGLIAYSAPYALGAALVASWGENLTGGDRADYGFLLAFASWFLTTVGYFFTG